MIFQKETMIHAVLITLPVQTALVTDVNICITAKGNVLEEAQECNWPYLPRRLLLTVGVIKCNT